MTPYNNFSASGYWSERGHCSTSMVQDYKLMISMKTVLWDHDCIRSVSLDSGGVVAVYTVVCGQVGKYVHKRGKREGGNGNKEESSHRRCTGIIEVAPRPCMQRKQSSNRPIHPSASSFVKYFMSFVPSFDCLYQ